MKEIRALTGIRGLAALTVFFAHTRETLEARGVRLDVSEAMQRLFLSGGRQVDIFFVLSGFILALVYARWFEAGVERKRYLDFLRRRLARIYPLHVVMLMLTLGLVGMAYVTHQQVLNGLDRFSAWTLPQTFLLIHAWGFAGPTAGPWNPPSWSISIEALAYLLFPGFLWLTSSLRKTHPWLVLAGVVAAGFACNAITHWGLAGFSGISRGLTEFALGCTTAQLFDSRVAQGLRTQAGSLLAVAILAICFLLTPDTGFIVGLCTAPLLLALSGNNVVGRFVGWGPIYFLGEISYSIYLGHFLFSSMAYRVIRPQWFHDGPVAEFGAMALLVAIVLGLSTLTYYTVERPGRDWLAGKPKARPTQAGLASPS